MASSERASVAAVAVGLFGKKKSPLTIKSLEGVDGSYTISCADSPSTRVVLNTKTDTCHGSVYRSLEDAKDEPAFKVTVNKTRTKFKVEDFHHGWFTLTVTFQTEQ